MVEPSKRAILIGLYTLTGLTSVAYEVLWVRMLSLQFGVSVFAVVITVATFMAGLGSGSLVMARRAAALKQPLKILAVLEGCIALYAILSPWLLQHIGEQINSHAGQLTLFQWYGSMAASAFFVLLIPAFAMGAGFSLIITGLGEGTDNVAQAYGMNTLGAALGALIPLFLLPNIGVIGSIRIIAAIGIITAMLMFWQADKWNKENVKEEKNKEFRPHWLHLLGYAGVGGASLILEIAWTRLFGMVLLRTEYVLAIILASFLVGLAVGSLIAPRKFKQQWFAALPLLSGSFTLLSLWLLPTISAWAEHANFTSLLTAMLMEGLVLVAVTIPVTLSLGAWLPMLNSKLSGGGKWLYGANSIGATLGAILSGAILIPTIGTAGAIVVAALAMLILGLLWARQPLAWLALPVMIAAALPVAKLPEISKLLPQTQAGSKNLYVYEDAVSMTHVIEQKDGQRLLLTDMQRMDASTDPTAVFVQSNQARLPLLLHQNTRSVLFLGLGTGISLSGALAFNDMQRYAVELSQGAINAADSWFKPANKGAVDEATVVRDDARHYLLANDKKYDVIIGDVFHPDLVGMSSLLSLQQFQRVHNRLNEGGLFVQWLALNQFDTKSLGVVLRTFKMIFPDAQMFLDGMHLALVGPEGKFAGATAMLQKARKQNAEQLAAETADEGIWTWLGRYCGPIQEGKGPLQDEWRPKIEFSLPRARYNGNLDIQRTLEEIIQSRPDMQTAESLLGVQNGASEKFERAYAATELMARSWLADMQGDTREAGRLIQGAYQANPKDRWVEYALADNMYASLGSAKMAGLDQQTALNRILQVNPHHVEALRALWKLQFKENSAQAPLTRAKLLAISPLDREVRTAQ